MTSGIQCLPTVLTFHPKAGLINLVSGLEKVGVLLLVRALPGHIVATIAMM